MATRIGFFIINNSRKQLVHTEDVPWDFGVNAEDGTVIEPTPLPPSEPEPIEGFAWNDTEMERMILYIQEKLSEKPHQEEEEDKPFILKEATFILSPTFAKKLGVVSIEKDELLNSIFLKSYPDLKTEIYLTTAEVGESNNIIVRLATGYSRVFVFEENNLPNFKDPEPIETRENYQIVALEEEETPEELFINWFNNYFFDTLIKDDKFLNHFNNNRTYIVISQENNNIMGTMTIHKGWSELDFNNHNYMNIINTKYPNIRNGMIIKDESFGGFDDDEEYQQDKDTPEHRPPHHHHPHPRPGDFGGFDDDSGFLI